MIARQNKMTKKRNENLIEKSINCAYNTVSSLVLVGAFTYCIGGEIKGISDYINNQTTSHVSSDIFLGKKEPTKLESKVINYFQNEVKF